MPVHDLDHYNLRAPRDLLDRLCAFYCEVVGLSLGERPPFRSFGYWLYAGNRPVLHLSEAGKDEVCAANVAGTFNHASFRCTGRRQLEHRLAQLAIPYRVARVPKTGEVQLFFQDPAGNGVELTFAGEDA